MTVQKLIEMLRKADPEAEAKAWDPDWGQHKPVSGIVYGGEDDSVYLQTDEHE